LRDIHKGFSISTVLRIMETLQEAAEEAYIDEDYEEAHILMADMKDLTVRLTDKYGPEWFTDDETSFLETILIYNL
jgi:hypothetical protein|tara:strand:+ start:153 stop:380 length:228 start_codon:yes stop_codon:yes gene_type:complete